jgi:hypothetical protein
LSGFYRGTGSSEAEPGGKADHHTTPASISESEIVKATKCWWSLYYWVENDNQMGKFEVQENLLFNLCQNGASPYSSYIIV